MREIEENIIMRIYENVSQFYKSVGVVINDPPKIELRFSKDSAESGHYDHKRNKIILNYNPCNNDLFDEYEEVLSNFMEYFEDVINGYKRLFGKEPKIYTEFNEHGLSVKSPVVMTNAVMEIMEHTNYEDIDEYLPEEIYHAILERYFEKKEKELGGILTHELSHSLMNKRYQLYKKYEKLMENEEIYEKLNNAQKEFFEKNKINEHTFNKLSESEISEIIRRLFEKKADMLRDTFGDIIADEYRKITLLLGLDENLARIMENRYIKSLGDEVESYHDKFTVIYYGTAEINIPEIDIQNLEEFVETYGYASILEMSEKELIQKFVKSKKELSNMLTQH